MYNPSRPISISFTSATLTIGLSTEISMWTRASSAAETGLKRGSSVAAAMAIC